MAGDSRRFEIMRRFGIGYEDAMQLQRDRLARLRRDRSGPGLLLAAEHAPIITLGRGGSRDNLLASPAALARAGVSCHEARRGGDITYHGPGQVTLYPVFPLEWWSRDLHAHMRRLEETGIHYLAAHGIEGTRKKGLTGVWVGEEKIAAIGIAVSAWIVYYGLAMNVRPEMAHFSLIRPCGIAEKGVTSLQRLTGRDYGMRAEMDRMAESFRAVFSGATLVEMPAPEPLETAFEKDRHS